MSDLSVPDDNDEDEVDESSTMDNKTKDIDADHGTELDLNNGTSKNVGLEPMMTNNDDDDDGIGNWKPQPLPLPAWIAKT
mmetsp:Transcript_12975/g.18529  ORF Transcript_12975/g.18529 Transcript_12975/m.18529 type:complete len:80 (-) Transcript_12975:597-836(-)